jgi:diguanylate cyclase (GGDEF)-like protein
MISDSANAALPAVLVVNDQPHSLLALAAALEAGPWRIVTTSSGVGAFKQLLIEDFAAIVLDVQMPGLNGFEVAEMIRTRPRCASTPIIFCSAMARTPDDQFKGYALGAVDYLLAPVAPHLLYSKVAVFVELYTQKRQLARAVTELEQARGLLERQNRELQVLATRDALTGCLNPRGLEASAVALFDPARQGGECSAISIHLDLPGVLAAQHGRAFCDACVRRLAWLLTTALRDDDLLCRWRDEQFVLVLAGTSIDAAMALAGQLVQTIRQGAGEKLLTSAPELRFTASLGVASSARGARTLEALIGQTETASRVARQAGGDQVCRHDQLDTSVPAT